jgi:hypothetical protein
MGATTRWERIIVIPDGYWKSSYNNVKWIHKEKSAKTVKRNKKL